MSSQSPDWVNALVTLLLDGAPASRAHATTLKRENTPQRLYRYRAPTPRSLENLRLNAVWLAPASDFNDPFDSAASIDFEPALQSLLGRELRPEQRSRLPEQAWATDIAPHDRVAALDELLTAAVVEQLGEDKRHAAAGFFRESLLKHSADATGRFSRSWQRELKIACFTEVPDSTVLWSHYAKDHTGFCVEYDLASLDAEDPRQLLIFPVVYAPKRFGIAAELVRLLEGGKVNPSLPTVAAIHKSPDWDYEREWRLIHRQRGASGGLLIRMPTPTRVLLGARCAQETRDGVMASATASGFPVYEMKLSATAFKLEPIRIAG
jgi:hypothetical protein